MKDNDKFPRIPKNSFGDQTGWLYAGALVACAHVLMKEVDNFLHIKPKSIEDAIAKMKDTIKATMEAAYEPMANSKKTSSKG